jgi:hypothetical protein
VHLETFHREQVPVIPVLERRPDFELMAIAPGDVRLYRLR